MEGDKSKQLMSIIQQDKASSCSLNQLNRFGEILENIEYFINYSKLLTREITYL